MARAKATKTETAIKTDGAPEADPRIVLTQELQRLGALVGGADTAMIDALVTFGKAISIGGNVFAYDATAKPDVLKAALAGHCTAANSIFCDAKASAGDAMSADSRKTYGYKFAAVAMVAARSKEIIPALPDIARAFVASDQNDYKPAKRTLEVFNSLVAYVRDEQDGVPGNAKKKRAEIPGRIVSNSELDSPAKVKAILLGKAKPAKTKTPAEATPAAAAAAATPAPAAPAVPAMPSDPAGMMALLKEVAQLVREKGNVANPFLLQAIDLIVKL